MSAVPDLVHLALPCPYTDCGNVTEAHVERSGYEAWQGGVRLQDAFPTLSPSEREFVKSGYCPAHMALIFGVDPSTQPPTP